MKSILKFQSFLHERPKPKGIDVICQLKHFSIITYAIEPERLNGLIPDRFQLETIVVDGSEKALISVVPFVDVDFTSAVYPFAKFVMGQTNYRIYVIDSDTGERCVWFLGTTLDSWTISVPRTLWNLPWYSGKVRFDCIYDPLEFRYTKYSMETQADWAPAKLELIQDKGGNIELPGFPDTETGLVCLTHPLIGYYHRRDGKLGTYRVWHKRLLVQPATLKYADFGLLSRMGIVSLEEQQKPYSVLIEPINEFTIYLPPVVVK